MRPVREEESPSRSAGSDSMLAALAGGLAHEIKNPLGVMSLNLQLLREDLRDAQTARERAVVRRLETVQRQVHRLEEILNDFLRYAGSANLRLEPCEGNDLVREILDFVGPELHRRQIRTQTFLAPDLPKVQLDRALVHQVLLNLLLNAQQAMHPKGGGDLWVRTSRAEDSVEFEIIDTGVGMTEEVLARAFDVYYSTKKEGTGLGLPTVRRIVERHGGTVLLESEPERGTRVRVRIPIAGPAGAPA